MVHLSVSEARELSEGILRKHGFDEEDARLITDVFVEAHLWGRPRSGLNHLAHVVEKEQEGVRGKIHAVRENDHFALLDGADNPGFLVANRAMRLAIEKARKSGLAVVGAHRSYMGGINGYYTSMAARADLIGMISISGWAQVVPWGGIDPMFGTNPFSISVPTLEEPVIYDIATASTNVGHLHMNARLKIPLPEGLAIDRDGEPTTDPHRALEGAILPFGGHKGSGLSMMVQCLGILMGGDITAEGLKGFGYFFLVIDPGLFMPVESYKAKVSELVRRIRSSRPRPGEPAVRVPGERALRERARCLKEGFEIDEPLYRQLRSL